MIVGAKARGTAKSIRRSCSKKPIPQYTVGRKRQEPVRVAVLKIFVQVYLLPVLKTRLQISGMRVTQTIPRYTTYSREFSESRGVQGGQ